MNKTKLPYNLKFNIWLKSKFYKCLVQATDMMQRGRKYCDCYTNANLFVRRNCWG